MSKKDKTISFRTSEENLDYLKDLAKSDERSLSYVLNKMLDYLRSKKIKKVTSLK